MRVDFQIVHSYNDLNAATKAIRSLLLETLQEEYMEKQEEEIVDWINIKYNHKSSDDSIMGFSLLIDEFISIYSIDDEDKMSTKIIYKFGRKLQEDTNVKIVLKFNDDDMKDRFRNFFLEIFEIEMKLREIITFIFIDAYKEEYYDLLKDIDLNLQKINGKNPPHEQYFSSHFENEFFFLLFSDYIKLNDLKDIKGRELISFINESNNYDDLKQRIIDRGVTNERYKNFLNRIKGSLESIEKLRNCVAHNRSFSDECLDNYIKAKDELDYAIIEFWEEVKTRK